MRVFELVICKIRFRQDKFEFNSSIDPLSTYWVHNFLCIYSLESNSVITSQDVDDSSFFLNFRVLITKLIHFWLLILFWTLRSSLFMTFFIQSSYYFASIVLIVWKIFVFSDSKFSVSNCFNEIKQLEFSRVFIEQFYELHFQTFVEL